MTQYYGILDVKGSPAGVNSLIASSKLSTLNVIRIMAYSHTEQQHEACSTHYNSITVNNDA